MTFERGQRVEIWGGDKGTVIAGPLADWNGAYEVAVDGDGLNYVIGAAMTALADDAPREDSGEVA